MIDNTYWHEKVTLFVGALNEIEQFRNARKERGDQDDGPDCKTQEESDINRAVRELLIALDSAATLRLEAKAAAVHAMRDGTIGERDFQAIMGAANI